jgi:hypothetical protein
VNVIGKCSILNFEFWILDYCRLYVHYKQEKYNLSQFKIQNQKFKIAGYKKPSLEAMALSGIAVGFG